MAYPDYILRNVSKPARYTGGEWNSIKKSKNGASVKMALAYPDTYEIGMSNSGLSVLYSIVNKRSDALAERVFAPWTDMEAKLCRQGQTLLSLESGSPIKDFDILGFSLGYELTFTNVLNMLELGGIPVRTEDRREEHPLIIAGGSSALNPEPMAEFIDVFLLGDGEELLPEFLDSFALLKEKGASREELLINLAAIKGVYVPKFYEPIYSANGQLEKIKKLREEAQIPLTRRLCEVLPPPVTDSVVPNIEIVQDRGAIEISRGCSRGCRFCNAGMTYRPVRERPKEEIIKAVEEIISNCGYDEISLLSLNTSDYSDIYWLIKELKGIYGSKKLKISLPSLRLSPASLELLGILSSQRKTGLTFAPEAGSPRLQKVINKVTPEEELMQTARVAFENGWKTLKLYFMLGLPTETDEDIKGMAELINKVNTLSKNTPGRKPQIRISVSTFIPKAHTPFQWAGQQSSEVLSGRISLLRSLLPQKGVKLSWDSPVTSRLEAVLSRGDRKIGQVIWRAWQNGAKFDAWQELFNKNAWDKAFEEEGIDPEFYSERERSLDEVLPWAHISAGVSTAFLKNEAKRALEQTETADCRVSGCNVCGIEQEFETCAIKFNEL